MNAIEFIQEHWSEIAQAIAYIIAAATVVVKITQTMSDDNWLLPKIKFISKYIALNTKTPTDRPNDQADNSNGNCCGIGGCLYL